MVCMYDIHTVCLWCMCCAWVICVLYTWCMCGVVLGGICVLSMVYPWCVHGVCVVPFYEVRVGSVGLRCMVCVVYCGVCMVCVLCMFGVPFRGKSVVSFWYICGVCYVTCAYVVYACNLCCMLSVHNIL